MIRRRSRVRVINYGHAMFFMKTGSNKAMIDGMRQSYPVYKESKEAVIFDSRPDIVGKEDVVTETRQSSRGTRSYALKQFGAWFSDQQLEEI